MYYERPEQESKQDTPVSKSKKQRKKPYEKPSIVMDETLQLSLYKNCDATPLDPS